MAPNHANDTPSKNLQSIISLVGAAPSNFVPPPTPKERPWGFGLGYATEPSIAAVEATTCWMEAVLGADLAAGAMALP